MDASLRLAELLCARLCHELSSPLGTLAGVMEMLTEGGATAAEARSVADEASVAVRARLRLLRAAWSGEAGPMDATEIRALAEGLRTSRRVSVDLADLHGHFPGAEARLLLNALILGVESLAGNGTLRAAGSDRDGVVMMLEGKRAGWPDSLAEGLAVPETAWRALEDPKSLQAHLLAILAASGSARLSLTPVPGSPLPALRLLAE